MKALLLVLSLPIFAELQVLTPRLLTHAPEMELTLSAAEHPHQSMSWRFVFERQTLSQGTVWLNGEGRALLRFQTPPPREGLALELELELSLPGQDKDPQRHKLWIFPEDAWIGGKEWLNEWPLWLYDPQEATAAWLERHAVPFQRVRDLSTVGKGALLVGEGVSFQRQPDLMGRLRELSASGIPVLVLAPARGVLDLPAALEGRPRPSIHFAGSEMITVRDPRLKGAGFTPQYFNLQSDRGRVRLATGADEGWSWLNITEEGGATLLFCGVALTTYEQPSPAPLLLLQSLLLTLRENTLPPANVK